MMKNDQSIDITGGRPPRRRRFVTVVASIAALAFFAAACSSDGSGASAGAENDPAETSVPTEEAVTPTLDEQSQASLDTVLALMGAMGSGDMETMDQLMADDMVWQNEGDKDVPWIGPWVGKEAIFGFLQVFSDNFETKLWENEDFLASGDTAAVFGRMNARMTQSGKETGEFTFALRAKVRDGQVVLWNWFEDSYAISAAYSNDNG